MRSRKIALIAVAALLVFARVDTPLAAQAPYSSIVVFGTSLSDPGNAFFLQGGVATPPDFGLDSFLIPDALYAKGGHHLTNGRTWVEQLGRSLGLARSVKPAWKPGQSGASNYAIATARAAGTDEGSLTDQVDEFLSDTGGVAPSDALYVIEMGTNDIRDALLVAGGGGNPMPILVGAATSVAQNIARLYAAGARNFLVWRAPSPGFSPAVQILDTLPPGGAVLGAHALTAGFNDALDVALAGVSLAPGISITRLAADALVAAIVAAPASFGLTNVTDACLTPGVPPFTCGEPDEYLFWDGIHPTKAVHAIIAAAAAAALGL